MQENDFSYANLANLQAIEQLYQRFLADPHSVEGSWRNFFEGMAFAQLGLSARSGMGVQESPDLRVYLLIEAYRKFGHLFAHCNPLATEPLTEPRELQLLTLGFKEEELNQPFPTCGFLPQATAPLQEIVASLRATYCARVGFECAALGSLELEQWIQKEIEPHFPLHLGAEDLAGIFHSLNKAEGFETFLHTKFVGQKRFSLEGCETLIPMLSGLIEHGAELGIEQVVLGMSHRGRLNVLANILNKSYRHIFHEFEDHYVPYELEGTGDVKYHKGLEGQLTTRTGKAVRVLLAPNPSHLETVDPVVEGIARAFQEKRGKHTGRDTIVPLLIHGDASIAGQGVVYETLQLSGLNGYTTGGTVHLVINNQIGFTTLPKDGRSTRYCSEIGRAFGCPVFHVSAESVKECVRVAHLAIEIRQKFHCDVIIDIVCYRKYGHNESDEPTFTQPVEYALIKQRPSVREMFRQELIAQGVLQEAAAQTLEAEFKADLQRELESPAPTPSKTPFPAQEQRQPTQVPQERLKQLVEAFCAVPDTLRIHPKLQRLLQERMKAAGGPPDAPTIDWGLAELMAYATLLTEKVHVRISGQDVRRGTFSHRHAIWVDQVKGERYFPLSHLAPDQAPFDIFNSPLSEYAVLGFDFGYSVSYPQSLVVWEAQFGDFVNGAQIIIDQYLSSSAQKWGLHTNLTLLLPHGNEGQGPEHTSARMERFLQMCAQDNMKVANCSTPAQLFHILRLQAQETKPLVLFTPKALLRHPLCLSPLNAFSAGGFQEVLDDPGPVQNPRRVLLCSGKVFYELCAEREKRGVRDVALIRIEQLYPFPKEPFMAILGKYKGATEIVWAQEEHQNMGAWEFLHPQLNELLNAQEKVHYVGRVRSASPAAGSHALHHKQLEELLHNAFSENKP